MDEMLLDEAGRARRDALTIGELRIETGLSERALRRLLALGLIDPLEEADDLAFPATVVLRIHRLLRLRSDLHLNFASLGLVLDLLERVDALERELARARLESTDAI